MNNKLDYQLSYLNNAIKNYWHKIYKYPYIVICTSMILLLIIFCLIGYKCVIGLITVYIAYQQYKIENFKRKAMFLKEKLLFIEQFNNVMEQISNISKNDIEENYKNGIFNDKVKNIYANLNDLDIKANILFNQNSIAELQEHLTKFRLKWMDMITFYNEKLNYEEDRKTEEFGKKYQELVKEFMLYKNELNLISMNIREQIIEQSKLSNFNCPQ